MSVWPWSWFYPSVVYQYDRRVSRAKDRRSGKVYREFDTPTLKSDVERKTDRLPNDRRKS